MGIFCIVGTESLLTPSFSYLLGCPWGKHPTKKWEATFFLHVPVCPKKTKWQTKFPEGFASPIPPSMGPHFTGRGWVISGRLANRFGSRFWTNTKLLLGVIGPISTPNDYLNTVFYDVVSLCGRVRNNALPHPLGKSFNLLEFYPCMWKVFP